MKKLLFIFGLLFFTIVVNSQIKKGTKGQLKIFRQSTTYFVKDDRYPMYNKIVEETLKDFWTITPFKIVHRNDIDTLISSKGKSFIIPSEVTIMLDGKKQNYIYLNTLQGGRPKLNGLADLGSFPLADVEDDEATYFFKVPLFLKLIQSHIAISEEAFELDYTELLKIYNKNSKKIENLELWVLDYDLEEEINTEEKIKSKYSNKIKIVSKEEMAKAILDNKEGIAIFHNVYPKNYTDGNESWKMVIDNATGEILYLQNKTISKSNKPQIGSKDLKRF